jgi:transcriptional regulator with XRE-family HTH domain
MSAAADLLRRTRLRAGLSQAELARRAGVPRSVLSAYEHASRDPGAETLARVLAAAGFELHALPARKQLDPGRADRILQDVLDLAEELPYRTRGLRFPPFSRRVA